MNNPDGYTALDLVGYTDQGDYNATKSYVANDLVHYGGSIWCCLIDDTVGITPTEGVNWRFWVENSQNGISDIVNILGAKNLLKISMQTTSSRGITVTDNGDGSITVDGTATADAYFNLMQHDFGEIRFSTDGYIDNSDYILSGLPTNTNFYIAYSPSNKNINLVVKTAYGAVDNVTIYPMIRPKSIEDDTWQPYTKTNKELTSDIQTLTNVVGDSTSGLVKDVTDLKNTVGDSSSGLVKDVTDLKDFKTMLDGYTARSASNRVILEVEADGVKLLGALMTEAYNQFAAYFSTTNAKVIKLFNIVVEGVATFVSRENGEYIVSEGAPGGCNVYNFDPQQDGSVIMYNANFKASANIINVTTLNADGTITTSPRNLSVPTAGQKIRFIMYEYL